MAAYIARASPSMLRTPWPNGRRHPRKQPSPPWPWLMQMRCRIDSTKYMYMLQGSGPVPNRIATTFGPSSNYGTPPAGHCQVPLSGSHCHVVRW